MEQQQDQPTQEKKSNKMMIIIIVIIVVIGAAAVVYFLTQSEETVDTTTTTNTDKTTNTAVTTNTEVATTNTSAPTTNAKPHDGKTISISSTDGKIEGIAGVKYTELEGNEYIFVSFFFKINETFSQKSSNLGNTGYSLLANHMKSTETRANNGNVTKGTHIVQGMYCEKDYVPDIFEIGAGNSYDQTIRYIDCTWGTYDTLVDTDSFYHLYTKTFSIDTFTLQDVYDFNKLEIYEASQFWVEEMYEGLESSYLDTAAGYASAPIVATYILEYEEQ